MVVEEYVSRKKGCYTPPGLGYFRCLRRERIDNGTWAFMKDVPYNILDETIKEAIQARDLVITETPKHKCSDNLPGTISGSARRSNNGRQSPSEFRTARRICSSIHANSTCVSN